MGHGLIAQMQVERELVGNLEVSRQVKVARTFRIARGRTEAVGGIAGASVLAGAAVGVIVDTEEIGQCVVVLGGEPLVGERAIEFQIIELGLLRIVVMRRGVPVVQQPDVEAEVAGNGALVAAIHVPFHAGAICVHVSAHARGPGSEIETAGVGIVKTGLHGRLQVRLRNAAEPVVRDQRGVARKRVFGGRGRSGGGGCRLRAGEIRKRKQARDGRSEKQFFHGCTLAG